MESHPTSCDDADALRVEESRPLWTLATLILAVHRRVLVTRTAHVLPYCGLGALFVREHWSPGRWVLLLLCAIFARATAVGFSRSLETPADVSNPVPDAGKLPRSAPPPRGVWVAFALHGAAVFVFLAFMLNSRSGWGAVGVLALLLVQSAARPYSGLSHLALGAALGAATLAGWVGFSNHFPPPDHGIWLLAAGATLWATGFDILYSLRASARQGGGAGHYGGPMALPLPKVIQVGRLIQVGALLLFTTGVFLLDLHPISYLGPGVAAVLLAASHHGLPRDGFHPASARFMASQLAIGPILFLGVLIAL